MEKLPTGRGLHHMGDLAHLVLLRYDLVQLRRNAKGIVMSESKRKKTTTRKPGRPTGSKTDTRIADSTPSRCEKCGSTDRSPYHNKRRFQFGGTDPSFGDYTAVIFRSTSCRNCGQNRVDRSFENRKRA